ncbi:2'-5' RNA ligase family protein [Halorubrum aethiopicum]|uniref:2'-5' RNA ligase family protein n=1 Tax=Halorubrum aethiopicum TaxID=1758255 RepID=UPI00082D6D5B|nr:2'-5' RNA ligase family protein [Halorubrum aethiopicum]
MSDIYSIWLQPDQDSNEYHRLSELIDHYSQRYDDAPIFAPHTTLLGGLSDDQDTITETTRTLAQEHEPFEVSFPRVHCSTTRYQCVFLLVEPVLELLSLYEDAVGAFEAGSEMYVPHLSLIYSDMSLQERLELVEDIKSESMPGTALLDTLVVVETTGDAKEWETIAEYEL